ncbi:mraZ protein [gamma proteobacterium HTCC5015]|nr:mraZ protein [gamma proteobacterium HTCC5015]
MFMGTSNLTLDSKHRMAMPARYRERIKEESGGQMVVTAAPPVFQGGRMLEEDPTLWLYTAARWKDVADGVMQMSTAQQIGRLMQELFLGEAEEVSLDAGGRVLLPARLRDKAGIEKSIVLSGVGEKFTIKSEQSWQASQGWAALEEVASEQVVEQLERLSL